jgi:O-acetylserine/cysteine efflux transporter
MALRDFFLLALVCVLWASNNIVTKFVVSTLGLPPLFFAAVRFGLVAAAVSPWLLPMPRPRWRLLAVALLMGALNFTLVFIGLKTATPSAVAVVSQVNMPMTTVLSMVMLGEQVRWRRGLGIVLTLAGALVVIWDPRGFHASQGLLWVVGSAFSGALGVVMMKQIEGVKPLQFQAWVGFSAVWPLAALSAVFEPGQVRMAIAAGWPFLAAALYSSLVVSVLAHTLYYGLIQRYDANLISPLTLMTRLVTIALGVMVTHDPFGLRMALGTAVALAGVLIIALRPNRVMPMLAALRNRAL